MNNKTLIGGTQKRKSALREFPRDFQNRKMSHHQIACGRSLNLELVGLTLCMLFGGTTKRNISTRGFSIDFWNRKISYVPRLSRNGSWSSRALQASTSRRERSPARGPATNARRWRLRSSLICLWGDMTTLVLLSCSSNRTTPNYTPNSKDPIFHYISPIVLHYFVSSGHRHPVGVSNIWQY